MPVRIKSSRENGKTFFSLKTSDIRVKKGIHSALCEIGDENVKYAKNLIIKPPKTGRLYLIDGKQHRASAPMEPPAARTRNLVRNTVSVVTGHYMVEIGYTELYGKYLEEGTSKMVMRPVLSRTARVKARSNIRDLESEVNRMIKA